MVRRTIHKTFRHDLGGFCGWDTLEITVKNININYETITRDVFVGIFELGARAMEIPTLKRRQVDLDSDDDVIWVRNMNVEKHRRKEYIESKDESQGRYIHTEKGSGRMFIILPTEAYRTFPIRKDNPLAKLFMDYVKKFSPEDILYPYSYMQMYYRICGIDTGPKYPGWIWWKNKGPWWLHRIRAERACQLRRDYKYDQYALLRFFGWATTTMPDLYVSMLPLDLKDDMYREKVVWR